MPAAPLKEADEPIVYVNGKRHILPEGNAETTLLQYLRGAITKLCTDLCDEVLLTPSLSECKTASTALLRAFLAVCEYWQGIGLTGTKLGCGEGGCGACTVMVSSWEQKKLQHRAINACLCPLYAVEGMHVVTVEGAQLWSSARSPTGRKQVLICLDEEAISWMRGSLVMSVKNTRPKHTMS